MRRRQPRNPWLAVVYWAAIVVIALVALGVAFYFLDDLLPGQGML